jgi:peptidyl-tRNA hydrolase
MDPCMYLLSNPSIPMSTGKRGAQLAHAAVEAYLASPDNNLKRVWHRGGHYKKIVLQTDDLRVAERYLNDRGFKTVLIIDEGHTEFEADLTPTAVGCAIVDKDDAHVAATFSAFKLYRDPAPEPRDPTHVSPPRRWRPLSWRPFKPRSKVFNEGPGPILLPTNVAPPDITKHVGGMPPPYTPGSENIAQPPPRRISLL